MDHPGKRVEEAAKLTYPSGRERVPEIQRPLPNPYCVVNRRMGVDMHILSFFWPLVLLVPPHHLFERKTQIHLRRIAKSSFGSFLPCYMNDTTC